MAYKGGGGGTTAGGNGGNGRAETSSGTTVKERIKSLSYSQGTNKLLLDIEADVTEGSVKEGTPGVLDIKNTGNHPTFTVLGYRRWTAEGTMDSNTYYVNYLLKPGENLVVPDVPAIIQDEDNDQYDGTAVSNTAPNSNLYVDSGTTLGENVEDTDTDFDVADGDYFRVGDLIQLGINDTTATRIEIMEVTAISTNNLTVTRALYGTSAADKDSQTNATSGAVSGAKVYFPIRNAYYRYNKFAKVQTDVNGKFKAMNFFGYGRAATHLQGITPGSVAIKFYNSGYQSLGLSGVTSGTNTGLTASTAYEFDIQVDGGTNFDNLSFTTDSSNVKFGGTNGVISKIQSALDTQYYTSGNLFEKKVTVGIVDGDIRFTSGSHLSTSAIALTAGSTGTAEFFGSGRITAVGSLNAAVAAKLPSDSLYDKVTYASSPNTGAFLYDDGYGNLFGLGTGTINYETGAISMIGCPPEAEFVVSLLHTSAFSGKQNATDAAKMNTLKAVYGNMTNQKASGELTITRK